MRKWVVVAIVLVIILAAAGLAVSRLDDFLARNTALLAERASVALGRHIELARVEVTLRGGLGARVSGLRIADDPAYSTEAFLRADTATVRLRLLPLLGGRYEVERIDLAAPHVAIIRTTSGLNVDSLNRPPPPPPPTAWLRAQPAFAAGPSAVPALPIGRLTARDATIDFIDRTVEPPVELRATQVDLTASDLDQAAPPQFDVAAAVLGATQRNLHLVGSIDPARATDAASLPVDLTFDLGPISVAMLQRLPAAPAVLRADLSVPDSIFINGTAHGPLDQLAVTATLDASQTAVQYGSLLVKSKSMPMTLALEALRTTDAIEIARLHAQVGEIELTARGRVSGGAVPAMDLTVEARPAPLAVWGRIVPGISQLDLAGTVAANLRARGSLSGEQIPRLDGTLSLRDVAVGEAGGRKLTGLTTTVTFTGDAANVTAARLTLAGVPIEVTATLRDPQAPQLALKVKAETLPLADLDLGWPTAHDQLHGVALDATVRVAEGGPQWHGTLTAARGRLRDVVFENLHADLGAGGGMTTLQALELRAYGGTLNAQGTQGRRDKDAPRFEVRATVRDMALAPLIATQDPDAAAKMEGRLQAQMTLTGAGRDWKRIQPTLQGTAQIAVSDGVIKDVNVAEEVLSGITGVAGVSQLVSKRVRRKYPALFGIDDTRFDQLGATLRVGGEQVATDDLVIAAPDYTIRAAGTIGFNTRVDLAATLQASRTLSADVIADVAPARYLANADQRIEVPFRVRGQAPDLRIDPDAEVIDRALRRALGGKGFGKGLDELLKQGRRWLGN